MPLIKLKLCKRENEIVAVTGRLQNPQKESSVSETRTS